MLASQGIRVILINRLVDCDCTEVYTVINENLVPILYEELGLELYRLSRPKLLRGFDGKLIDKPITYCLLPNLIIQDY